MALAGDEMAHEKIGATMHGGVTTPQGSLMGGGLAVDEGRATARAAAGAARADAQARAGRR